jgi:hypothetical protein
MFSFNWSQSLLLGFVHIGAIVIRALDVYHTEPIENIFFGKTVLSDETST